MVREDDLRATFSALHAEGAPPRAVTAADLIQRGQTVRSRRRTIAVVGTGLATVGVVAVALAVLPGATPSEPLAPGPATTTVSPTTPSPTSVESTPTTVWPTNPPNSSRPQPPVHSTTSPGTSSSQHTAPPTKPDMSTPQTTADSHAATTPPSSSAR